MKRIIWNKISFQQGIEHLQGKQIVEKPHDIHDHKYEKCEAPDHGSIYNNLLTFFDDDTVMSCVSDWDSGYYGDVDANDPLFYLGKMIEISNKEIEKEKEEKIKRQKQQQREDAKRQAEYWAKRLEESSK
jgi:hypothetical protein